MVKMFNERSNKANKRYTNLNGTLAFANIAVANVLNSRGDYSEAMSYAREATILDATNGTGFDALGDSFYYLQRYNEAVAAEKEAIRLTDGKFSYMHFRLGTAYAQLDQWRSARDSFEMAWNENPKNDTAAYNVAISLVHEGFNADAAQWYRKVLKINPAREDKDEISRGIQALSQ